LLARGHDVDLRIAGDGLLRDEYQALIKRLGVENRVTLLGALNQPEIVQLLDDCDIFLGPSITAPNGDQDAPTNVLKEAMALGLPVIATRHGGIPELVEDGVSGLLVPERDGGAIATAIVELIAHPERWPDMGRAGRSAVEARYDNDLLNDQLIQSYEAVLHRSPQTAAVSPGRPGATASRDTASSPSLGDNGPMVPLSVRSELATDSRPGADGPIGLSSRP